MRTHVIAQHYLRGFAAPGPKPTFVWQYEKGSSQPQLLSIRLAMGIDDYFTEEDEQWLRQIEWPAHKVLDKMRQSRPISREEQLSLAIYIQVTLFRVEEYRDKVRSRAPSVIDRKFADAEQLLLNEVRNDLSKAPLLNPTLTRLRLLKDKWKQELPEDMWQRLIHPSLRPQLVELLLSKTWCLLVASKDAAFVGSDTPVLYQRRVGLKESNIVFPLSSSLALYLGHGQGLHEGRVPVPKEVVEMVNEDTILNARRYVFHSANDPALAAKMVRFTPT